MRDDSLCNSIIEGPCDPYRGGRFWRDDPLEGSFRDGPRPDWGAITLALSRVEVQACWREGGPTGRGRVTLVFGNDGHVQSATIATPPFARTEVAQCLFERFRYVEVPPFRGISLTVSRTFKIIEP
jgi:hypothetical protein